MRNELPTISNPVICFLGTLNRGQHNGQELIIRVSPDMIRKGLTIRGSWHYNLSLFPKIVAVIQGSPVVEKLISHVFPMSRIQEAFEVSASHECAKIILKPWE